VRAPVTTRLARAAALAVALLAGGSARAGTPVALAERQVATLEFDRPIARVSTSEPDVARLEAAGVRLRVIGARAGRAQVEVGFEDGAVVALDVTLAAATRPAATAPGEVEVVVGAERRVPAAGVARVLVEENGVARVRADGQAVWITGVSPGTASLLLVDEGGARTTWTIRVR